MQPQPAPFSSFLLITTLFRDILSRRVPQALISAEAAQVQTYLKDLFSKTRLYMLRDVQSVADEWAKIRPTPALVDLMLTCTNDLSIVLAHAPITFDNLLQDFARANSRYHLDKPLGAPVAMDADLHERLPKQTELLALYTANPWLLSLFLIEAQGPGWLNNLKLPETKA